MALKSNTFEGGNVGDTVTIGADSAAGGTAWDAVNIAAGGYIKYINSWRQHGALACEVFTPAGTTTWLTFNGYSATQTVLSLYFRFPTLPGTNGPLRLFDIRTGSTSVTRVVVDTTNHVLLQVANGGTTLKTYATALSAATGYRLDVATTNGTSGATVKADLFVGDSTTPVEAGYSSTTVNTGVTANIAQVVVGINASAAGPITVQLDDVRFQDGTLTYLGVPATPPTAAYTYTRAGLSLAFDGTTSTNSSGGTVSSYSWDFGDGSATVTTASPSHTYAQAGSYPVALTVTDGSGQTATVTKSVVAKAPSGTVGVERVLSAVGWTVVGAADTFTALSDGDNSTLLQASAPTALELDVQMEASIAPTPGNPYKVFLTVDAQLSTSAIINAQLFEGSTQRSAVTGQVIPSGSGSSVGSTIAASFPWADVSAMSTGGWNAPIVKTQTTAS